MALEELINRGTWRRLLFTCWILAVSLRLFFVGESFTALTVLAAYVGIWIVKQE
ncbi:MAG TPA: hypothetical protein VEI95_19105 [Acidobacteriota bacterium]|nr:hypothetical protein [Acidobacteriota bacterium]